MESRLLDSSLDGNPEAAVAQEKSIQQPILSKRSEAAKVLESGDTKTGKIQPGDFYFEKENMVFTEQYHLRRGYCCGSGCRHCPY